MKYGNDMKNVEMITVKNNMCVSCGFCRAVCSSNCIEYELYMGKYIPRIIQDKCTECGICIEICPSLNVNFNSRRSCNETEETLNQYIGRFTKCFSAYSKNVETRINSVSGGCVTTLIQKLLDTEEYDVAFLVDSFNYLNFCETKAYRKNDNLKDTAKSRYIPISHESMVKYILEKREEKIIVVATSCAVHALNNVINKFKLSKEKILILGLFCDKVMNYNIFDYFEDYNKMGESLKNLVFRTKENSVWPGHLKLEYGNNKSVYLPSLERIILKDYFVIERCLYCIDKLNQFADISFGDCYSKKTKSEKGLNSVIIRSAQGSKVWEKVKDEISFTETEIDDIYEGQKIDLKRMNYIFSLIKDSETNLKIYKNLSFIKEIDELENRHEYEQAIEKLQIGEDYINNKKILAHELFKKYYFLRISRKIKDFIKRILTELKNNIFKKGVD